MARRYVKKIRSLTPAEKGAFKTVRHLLRQGIDVRISFTVKGWPNALPEPPKPETPEEKAAREEAEFKKWMAEP